MNPQDAMHIAKSLLQGHGRDAAMLAAGAVLSNPVLCAYLVFVGITKIPLVGPWMGRNPDKVKGWLKGFTDKVDELEDKYAAQQAKATGDGTPKAQA